MHSDEIYGILSKDVLAKLGQKPTSSPGEDSTAQSSVWHESRRKRLQPTCSSTDLSLLPPPLLSDNYHPPRSPEYVLN